MPKVWLVYVDDMLLAASEIQRYIDGKCFEDFISDTMLERAVIQCFTVIGEAVNRIPISIQDRYSEVPWHRLRGLRNILVHQYDEIEYDILWTTAKERIPELILSLQAVIKDQTQID